MYADDTNVYRKIQDCDDVSLLQNDINKVIEWSDKQPREEIHPGKCIHFSTNIKSTSSKNKYELALNDESLF